jgi:hypothetical protein
VKRPRDPEQSIHRTLERAFEEKAREDAQRIRHAVVTMSRGLIAGVMASHLAATALVGAVVFSEPFPYPAMYLLMGLLLWLFVAIRFTAWAGGRRISATALLVANVVLHVLWIGALVDQIPGQKVVTGRVVARPDLPTLWVPVAMYMLAMAGMIAHAFVHWRGPRRA